MLVHRICAALIAMFLGLLAIACGGGSGSAGATSAPALIAPAPTTSPEPTLAVTDAAVTTAVAPTAPAPTSAPAEDRYVSMARAGVTIPLTRPDGSRGEWKADHLVPGGVSLTMPVSVGLSNDQTVRQAKRQIAQAVKALFDGDAALKEVNVIGTTPLGGNEAPAVSIVVSREAYAAWGGSADTLGRWNVSQRLK